MISKMCILLTLLTSSFYVRAEERTGQSQQSPQYEKLTIQKFKRIKISQQEVDEGNKATLEAIEKSSPEVKAALLKAAQELANKKKAEEQSQSNEQ